MKLYTTAQYVQTESFKFTFVDTGGSVVGSTIDVGLCEQALPIALTLISSTLISREGMVNPNSL